MFVWLLAFCVQYRICAIYNQVCCVDVPALLSSHQWGFVGVGACFFFYLIKLMKMLLTTYIWTDAISDPFTVAIFFSERSVC